MVVIDILKATQQLHPRWGPKYHTIGANVPIGEVFISAAQRGEKGMDTRGNSA